MTSPARPGSSIIIPSFNRPERLKRCLEALMLQDEPDFEIVVVDDGSPTSLAEICAGFGPKVRCVRQENAGAGAARNRAAKEAKGDFLAFTDDDCMPHSGWLRALRETHNADPSLLVGGDVRNGLPNDVYASTSQELCDYLYDYFGAATGDISFFTTNNMGCARASFLAIGGFDADFPRAGAEDRDFGMRWRESGRQLVFVPSALVDHFHDMSLKSFLKQHWNYGRGARILHKHLDARGSTTPKVEPFRFYRELILWPLRKHRFKGIGKCFLMGLTQVAMIAGYGYDVLRERKDSV